MTEAKNVKAVYGVNELGYAEPFADALVDDPAFRSLILRKTKFSVYADDAKPLQAEMRAQRGKSSKYWWRSHYTERCRCFGCSGQETDLLALFETSKKVRFALHVEVKNPRDRFSKPNQAKAYPIRARCWAAGIGIPRSVLPHSDAATALLCSETKLAEFGPHLRHFDAVITFEEIKEIYPRELIAAPKRPPPV